MSAFIGQRVTQSQAADAKLIPYQGSVGKPRTQFILTHNPQHWEFIRGKGWLPHLSPMPLDPGVNGVGLGPDSSVDSRLAKAHYLNKGCVLLQLGDARLGDDKDYLMKHMAAGQDGKPFAIYTTVWDEPRDVAGQVRWKMNSAAYTAFRERLISSGVIAAMHPELKELRIADQEAHVERLEAQAAKSAADNALQHRLKLGRELLAEMKADLEKGQEAEQKKQKKDAGGSKEKDAAA